jgi:hypothetical protein
LPHALSLEQPNPFGQARCDRIQAAFHQERAAQVPGSPARKSIRRDPPPRPPVVPPTDDVLSLRLAEELDYARRILETMGNDLSNDPMVIARHMVALQSVDVISQLLGHVANVVRSSQPSAAAEQIGMVELKARLTRRSIG